MQLWRSPGDVPADLTASVVTIGVFDGVHRGHQAVIGQAAKLAHDHDVSLVVVTFDPHPLRVLRPDRAPDMLTGLEQRARLLTAAGADAVFVLNFTPERSHQSASDFVREVPVGLLHAVAVVVGRDFRFGHKAAGNVDLLRRMGAEAGFEVVALEPVGHDGERWSSTRVREALLAGDVAAAAEVLGRPFRVEGTVVAGEQRGGSTLGFPTANIPVRPGEMVPADGVYAGRLVRLDEPEKKLPAAISVGTNPTFDGTHRRVEAYVLDRDDLRLYGVPVGIEFVAWVRGMERFESVPDLIAQMTADVEQTRMILSR